VERVLLEACVSKQPYDTLIMLIKLDHEATDASTFASWGADMLKCNCCLPLVFDLTDLKQTIIAIRMQRQAIQMSTMRLQHLPHLVWQICLQL
jgi:hypothetical protein